MSVICYKEKNACKSCPHYRLDEDTERKCCFVSKDAKFKVGERVYYDNTELIIKSIFISGVISYEVVLASEPNGSRYHFNEKVLKSKT